MAYLQHCRPLSVSISNALKHLKWQITQLAADQSEFEQRAQLLDSVDTYIRDQVEKAAQAISISVQQKISNGDVILTFGCSSLISHILDEAQKRQVDFRVVVVDARPDHEGQEMLRRLVAQGIRCTCVLVNAIGFIMPVVSVFLSFQLITIYQRTCTHYVSQILYYQITKGHQSAGGRQHFNGQRLCNVTRRYRSGGAHGEGAQRSSAGLL